MSVPAKLAQTGRDTRIFLWRFSPLCVQEGRTEAEWVGVTLEGTKPAGVHHKGNRSMGHENWLM